VLDAIGVVSPGYACTVEKAVNLYPESVLRLRLGGSLTWTVEEIRERLAEAAHVLNRLPMGRYARPQDVQCAWPDVVYDWLAYGWNAIKIERVPPTPVEITRMDEVLPWLNLLAREQRLLVWARANHWHWPKIAQLDDLERNGRGRSINWLRKIMHDGEARILSYLNGTPGRMRIPHHAADDCRFAGTPHVKRDHGDVVSHNVARW
jgi:hypothetical protein